MKRVGTLAMLSALLVCMAGCATEAYRKSIEAEAETLAASPAYRIGEGDQLTITVLGHEEYTIDNRVRPDGAVSFPEHGEIQVAGKTPDALRKELEQAFKKSLGLKAPKVHVAVNTFDSKFVTILGQVERPGRYAYVGQMRITDLYGLSIGPTLRAKKNNSLLFRELDGAMKIYQIKLKDFFDRGDFTTNFYVRPGDIVWVPRHGFAKTADYVRIGTEPIAAIFEAVGLGNNVQFFAPGP